MSTVNGHALPPHKNGHQKCDPTRPNLHAMAETVDTKPVFRDAFERRWCQITPFER